MGGFGLRLLVVALSVVALVLVFVLALHIVNGPKTINRASLGTVNGPAPIGINTPIYVVGPTTLIQGLTSIGINQSLIRPVGLSELPSLPNNSLVLIDWSVIGPGLIINGGGLVHVNVSSTNFKLIRELIGRGDFVVIHGNSSDVPLIEYTLALAWSRAYNTSIVAIPMPKYPSGLNYVAAFGNNHALVIGPHTLSAALNIASKFWIPMIMKISTPDPTGEDICLELIQTYSLPQNEPALVNNAYIIAYGEQAYSDSYGSFQVDFCTSWSSIVDQQYGKFSIGYAELYNFIEYIPNSGTEIEYLKAFQDGYASYIVYEYELGKASQLPGDVQYIASTGGGYEPGYWTDPNYSPQELLCSSSTTYTVSVTTGFSISLSGPSAGITISQSTSSGYNCPYYTIFPSGSPSTATPLGYVAANSTWVFTPQNAQAATAEQAYGVESNGFTYMGPAYTPLPTAFTIPAGASVVVNSTSSFWPCSEEIVYDIDWDVWVSPYMSTTGSEVPVVLTSNSQGLNINNGFYHTTSCWLG